MTPQQPTPTDIRTADRIAELRDSAEEAQAARLEVVTEIARLTKALRQAEACWEGAKALHRTAAVERNSLRTQLVQAHSERDAARQDAERIVLIWTCADITPEWRREQQLHWADFIRKNWPELSHHLDILAAHAAATGKGT